MKRIQIISKDKLNRSEQLHFLLYLRQSLDNGLSLATAISLLPLIWPQKSQYFVRLEKSFVNDHNLEKLFLQLGFSAAIVVQISLAMKQGKLVDCLDQLCTLVQLRNEQIKKLKAELSYPGILAIMMLFLLVFMQNFVSSQFAESDDHTGDLMIFVLIILTLVFFFAFVHILSLLKREDYQSLLKLQRLPFIGQVVRHYGQYLLIYDLWLLLSSGFSLQEMCAFALKQNKLSLQYQIGLKAKTALEAGRDLKQVISQEIFLSDQLLLLLETGNDRRKLSQSILLLGESFFLDLKNQIEKIVVNIQPFCFILIGLCIIGMYLKLLLPMYNMLQTI